MSSALHYLLEIIPPGSGLALDLGGGFGSLRHRVQHLGYHYINLDLKPYQPGEPSLIADSHDLPFQGSSFDLVISKDTLEHFINPWKAVSEVHRILNNGGLFAVWVPFMHPFHGDDFYRYSPLGLKHLLTGFDLLRFDSPLWAFSVVGSALGEMCRRSRLRFLEPQLKRLCAGLDHLFMKKKPNRPAGFAAAYRLVARKVSKSSKTLTA